MTITMTNYSIDVDTDTYFIERGLRLYNAFNPSNTSERINAPSVLNAIIDKVNNNPGITFTIKDLNNNLIIDYVFTSNFADLSYQSYSTMPDSDNGENELILYYELGESYQIGQSFPLYDQILTLNPNIKYKGDVDKYIEVCRSGDIKLVFSDNTEIVFLQGIDRHSSSENPAILSGQYRLSNFHCAFSLVMDIPHSSLVSSDTDLHSFVSNNPNQEFKVGYNILTTDLNYSSPQQVSAQTISFPLTRDNPSQPIVFDHHYLESGYFWLENAGGSSLTLLTQEHLPATTTFNLTIAKNGQSFTLSNLVISRSNGINNGWRIIPAEEYRGYFEGNAALSGRIDPISTQQQIALNSFITSAGITKNQWGGVNDSAVTLTFTIAEQSAAIPGYKDILTTDSYKLEYRQDLVSGQGVQNFYYEIVPEYPFMNDYELLMQTRYQESGVITATLKLYTAPSSGGSGGGSGGSGSGGSGGGSTPSVTGTVLVGGKAVGTVTVDPRTTAVKVTINGVEQALPLGSVVRNTVTGQKFLKSEGGELAFVAIELTPKAEWSWSASADDAWEVLQGL